MAAPQVDVKAEELPVRAYAQQIADAVRNNVVTVRGRAALTAMLHVVFAVAGR